MPLFSGEYIAVEVIEEAYKKCIAIDQVWVYGDSFKSFLVAVVVPQSAYIKSWASGKGMEGSDEDLVKNVEFKEALLESMTTIAKAGGLQGFKIVKVGGADMYLELFPSILECSFKLFVSMDSCCLRS